jgi:hypothetical protein
LNSDFYLWHPRKDSQKLNQRQGAKQFARLPIHWHLGTSTCTVLALSTILQYVEETVPGESIRQKIRTVSTIRVRMMIHHEATFHGTFSAIDSFYFVDWGTGFSFVETRNVGLLPPGYGTGLRGRVSVLRDGHAACSTQRVRCYVRAPRHATPRSRPIPPTNKAIAFLVG